MMAKDMSVIGSQSFSASHMIQMKEASAVLATTAAFSDVGGESSPNRQQKREKCAIQEPPPVCPL